MQKTNVFGFDIIVNNKEGVNLEGNSKIVFTSPKSKKVTCFGYNSFDKFSNDSLFIELNDLIIGVDGVLLNFQQLKNEYAKSNLETLILHLWMSKGQRFVRELKGEFNGFIFNKKNEELFVFVNQTGTKPLYYHQTKDSLLVFSDIYKLINCSKKFNNGLKLNKTAFYDLVTYGAMIERNTLAQDVYKLMACEFLLFSNYSLKVGLYEDLNLIDSKPSSNSQSIESLDETFSKAVRNEYEKDLEYGFKHIATLSGGLDSRFNVLNALKQGYRNDVFCFSQSKYLDNRIANEIAKYYDLNLDFIPLDGGDYFKNIEKNVRVGRGGSFYISAAHLDYALNQQNLSEFGLLHTGLIGDAILGGLLTKDASNFSLKTISNKFKHKGSDIEKFKSKYNSSELFRLVNRIFNLTNTGSFVVESHNTYLVSPFMDIDFIKTCLAIKPELKYNGKLYIEWINKRHKELTKFTWERTAMKPTTYLKTQLSLYSNKLKLELFKLLKLENNLSMNPVEYWYRNNNSLPFFFDQIFNDFINQVNDKELEKDLRVIYGGSVIEKTAVLTLIEFVKKNNIEF